jgi:hypothetical protein
LTCESRATRIRTITSSSKGRLPWLNLGVFGDQPGDKGCLRYDDNLLTISGVEYD